MNCRKNYNCERGQNLCSSLVHTKKSAIFATIRCCLVGESIRQQCNEVSSPASSCLFCFICFFLSPISEPYFSDFRSWGQHLSEMVERLQLEGHCGA